RHDSFRTAEFVALARDYQVAIVLAADGEFPQIADLTAPFVYARIMGTTATEANGYAETAIGAWTERVKLLANGDIPRDLRSVGPAEKTRKQRDVFLYVISGYKAHNPKAAMAILERL
ncbi:MAG: DUF72 domain-containing protein, partial [Acetobacteraceae bacterium]